VLRFTPGVILIKLITHRVHRVVKPSHTDKESQLIGQSLFNQRFPCGSQKK